MLRPADSLRAWKKVPSDCRTGERLPAEKIEEYTLNASVLDVLVEKVQEQRIGRNRLKNSTRIIWENILATAEQMRNDFHHTLPENAARLKDKLRAYEREGFASLVSKKFCNANKSKITPEGGRLLVALRRSRIPVYTLRQIFEEYNRRAEQKGWKTLESMNSVTAYLDRPDIAPKWWAGSLWRTGCTPEVRPQAANGDAGSSRCLVVWRRYEAEPLL